MATYLSEPAALGALADALQREREALVGNDIETLLSASQAKLDALRTLEASPPPADFSARMAELAEMNRENGQLLSRRRRVVDWTLRQLGRQPQAGVYDTHGSLDSAPQSRVLGAA